MPIYEFVCDKCGLGTEVCRPMSEAGQEEKCSCGLLMRRIFSPPRVVMVESGRDRVLATLNREEGAQTYPGGEKYGVRYDKAMAKGLDPPKQTIGRGLG